MLKPKLIIVSVLLILLTYILPFYILNQNQSNYSNIQNIQKVAFVVLLIGASILTYLNYSYKNQIDNKWLASFFKVVGILGIAYSAFVLFLLFAFRKGIGL